MSFTRKEADAIAAAARAIGRTQGAHVCVLAEAKPEKVVGMDSTFGIAVVRVTPEGHKRTVCLTEAEALAAARGDTERKPLTTLTIPASDLKPGDVIAGTVGGPAFTVKEVDAFGPLVIVDFADNTATPPLTNGLVTVERPDGP